MKFTVFLLKKSLIGKCPFSVAPYGPLILYNPGTSSPFPLRFCWQPITSTVTFPPFTKRLAMYLQGYSSRYVTNSFYIFYNFNWIFIVKTIWLAFTTKFLYMEGCPNTFADMMPCYGLLKLKRVRVKIMYPCHFQLKNNLFDKNLYEPNRMHCSFQILECISVFECYKQNRTIAFYLRLLDFKQLPTWKKRGKVTLYDSKVKF